ncbi:MAG: DUF4340 domain-containing protein [Verrucomicrobiae bacterium]|nr:DUF4340 domain-containing protein [Verrucomicrobiae bacterium]MCP5538644.1 DUF4340 domain-containing protein [Akkermansiaceae bacterium]MCP5550895.1 DUF4340 domain-containing protein [Akkermansiaceae bacterium]
MGPKALIRLLIVLAALGAIALIVKFTQPGQVETVTTGSDRTKVFEDFPINDVAQVRIQTAAGEVNLAKGEKTWGVAERDGYPADNGEIGEFLTKVWDLKVVQSPELGESQFTRLKLLDPAKGDPENAATVVSFRDAGGQELRALWLGKILERRENRANPFGDGQATTEAGRYVKTGSGNDVFLVSELFKNVEIEPASWLNENFFKVDKLKAIAIKTGNAADDWKLSRDEDGGDLALAEPKPGEELDETKVSAMKTAFNNPRFEDVIVGDEAKEKKPAKTTFEIDTFEDFHYTVTVGEKNDLNELHLTFDVKGNFPTKRKEGPEESDEEKKKLDEEFAASLKTLQDKLNAEKAMAGKVFKVRSYVADSITKKRSEILKEKKEGDAADSPVKIPQVPNVGPIPGGGAPPAPKAATPRPAGPKPAPTTPKPAEKPAADAAKKAEAPKPAAAEKPAPKADAPKPDAAAKPSGQ